MTDAPAPDSTDPGGSSDYSALVERLDKIRARFLEYYPAQDRGEFPRGFPLAGTVSALEHAAAAIAALQKIAANQAANPDGER
jgi:hypothetical protein